MHLSIDELASILHLPSSSLEPIQNISWGKNLMGEPPENLPIVTREMPIEQKKEINPFAKTLYKNQEAVYGLKREDRRRHMYVIGKTGTGKSTLLANMAINDLKNDEGLCVIDPHGDLVETLLNYIPSRRINDVIYFDPADPERTVQLNLFEGENVAHRELIASGIVSVFQKLYAYSWGPRLEYILRNALLTLLKSETARLSDIIDLLTNKKFRDSLVEELDDPVLKNFWLYEFNKLQDRQRTEAIAPILNKVGQFVSSPLIRDVVNSRKSSFSIEEAMDQGKIVLVNLSQGKLGEDNATLLGAMLITKIQLAAMSRVHVDEEHRRDFYLYVDEFQNFATESFNKILSEARKYRLNLILANQYIAQIPEEVQKAIFGNCGSIVSFVMGAEDAAAFEREYGERYTKEDLVSLSKHQIINKLSIDNMISRPFPAFTLGPAKSTNKNRGKVIKVSSERYAKRKKSLDLAAEFQANKERMDQTDEEKQAQIAEEQRRAEINKKAREAEGSQKPKNNKQNQGKNSNQNHNNQQNKKN
ncbi:MAG: type IV secretion system DNA-binding domain-containing protein [Candidatus Pacebacteria bacterium]|nr:type IV secretion system DNA-binding domain-containing protein [Candidatus Paceibacterota bacterium]